jgi:sigma-B regulation protein RsbU (phosphoserine phosphatase)
MQDDFIPLAPSTQNPAAPSSFLEGLDAATAAFVQQHLEEQILPAGHVVVEQDTLGDTLYIVKSGFLDVKRRFDNDLEHVLGTVGPGEIFGEMALLEDQPRSAQVVTATPTHLLVMSRETFQLLIEQQPSVIVHLLRLNSARLRRRNQQQAAYLAEKLLLVEELAAKNAELERTFEQLQKAMQTVVEHERVTRDLEIARQIQQQMLPVAFPQVPRLQIAASTVPSQWVGGDFYDAVQLQPHRVCLLLGDVSGKGIPAAMQMARLMGEFRACLSRRSDPVSVVQALNESVCTRNVDWTSFVTLQYVVLDLAARQMTFICAGHAPLLLCAADGQVTWLGQTINRPLGIDAAFVYQYEAYTFKPGDRLLLYSDGAYELQNDRGERLGLARLATLFAAAPSPPSAAIGALREALVAFAGTQSLLHDDTTFVCAHMD